MNHEIAGKYAYITPDRLFEDSYQLADSIAKIQSVLQLSLIIAIARGGFVLAQVLSDVLELPVASFTIQSYTGLSQTPELQIPFKFVADLHGQNLLVVDDLADTGRTFLRARTYLAPYQPRSISTAVLYKKPQSAFTPDFYVGETDKWIVFPHEKRETFRALETQHGSDDAQKIWQAIVRDLDS